MTTVIRAKRRSPVLASSGLACLSTLPTINLTTGCLHDCLYCYIRGYRNYPGEGRIVLYENTLDLLQDELSRMTAKPHAVYFSPSSDLFQPAPEVLDLSHAVLQFLFSQGVGVAFLTKGVIPGERSIPSSTCRQRPATRSSTSSGRPRQPTASRSRYAPARTRTWRKVRAT